MLSCLALIRALHFGSALILARIFTFRWQVLPPALRRKDPETRSALAPLWRSLGHWQWAGFLLHGISGVLWLWLVIISMSDSSLLGALDGKNITPVLWQTQFGHLWLFRGALFLLFGAVLGLHFRTLGCGVELICAGLALCLLISLSAAGHAAANTGPHALGQLCANTAHLFACGFWPAGLLPLTLLLRHAHRVNNSRCFSVAAVATQRFLALSLGAVGFLTLTGVVNSASLVGSWQGLIARDYGHLLLLKLFFSC